VPTNKQRREAARRHLERQVERRQQREATRRRITLYGSIGGTVLAVVLVIVLLAALGGGSSKNKADNPTVSSPTGTPTSAASSAPAAKAATGPAVSYHGVTVKGAADLNGYPVVTSTSTTDPTTLDVKDLVVGTGAVPKNTSTVTVHYVGVLYKDGKQFDSSWSRGAPAQFSLTGVIPGFQQGIGGTSTAAGKSIAPMRVGGRRIIIVPAKLGYGSSAQQGIPANSTLVFVVDLKAVS
jgi:peptidylprolyl isomerase